MNMEGSFIRIKARHRRDFPIALSLLRPYTNPALLAQIPEAWHRIVTLRLRIKKSMEENDTLFNFVWQGPRAAHSNRN